MPKIELNREYRTRDGRQVRILCVDAPGDYPVVGYFKRCGTAQQWTGKGSLHSGSETPLDLIPVPRTVKVDRWIVVNRLGCPLPTTYPTEQSAKEAAGAQDEFGVYHLVAEVPELEAE